MDEHLLPACHRWIQHVMDRQPPQGRGPWVPGRYHLQPIDLWLNCQKAGDYNTPYPWRQLFRCDLSEGSSSDQRQQL